MRFVALFFLLVSCGVNHDVNGTVEIAVSGRAEIVHRLELVFHCTAENGFTTPQERKACLLDALECYYSALDRKPQEGENPCHS